MNTPIHEVPRTNGKAIAAMVLGILSLLVPYVGFILGIIAIILGVSSKKDIRRTGEAGQGMATAGFVTGIISVVLYGIIIILAIIGFAIFSSAKGF